MPTWYRNPTSDIAAGGTWSGTAGSRYQAVDDYGGVNEDADYLDHGTTAGYIELGFSAFNIPSFATSISVAVDVRVADPGGGGNNNLGGRLRINSNPYNKTPFSDKTTGTPRTFTDTWTFNPARPSSGAWQAADINGTGSYPLQGFGVASGDANPVERIYSIRIGVTFTADVALAAVVASDSTFAPPAGSGQTLTLTVSQPLNPDLIATFSLVGDGAHVPLSVAQPLAATVSSSSYVGTNGTGGYRVPLTVEVGLGAAVDSASRIGTGQHLGSVPLDVSQPLAAIIASGFVVESPALSADLFLAAAVASGSGVTAALDSRSLLSAATAGASGVGRQGHPVLGVSQPVAAASASVSGVAAAIAVGQALAAASAAASSVAADLSVEEAGQVSLAAMATSSSAVAAALLVTGGAPPVVVDPAVYGRARSVCGVVGLSASVGGMARGRVASVGSVRGSVSEVV